MDYNTTRNKLVNGEYGRHIQKMIEYAIEVKDRELRNQQAKAIVRAMSCFSQGTKDTEDYWHKLWDQLFVISDFKLDVDSPFPKPTPARMEMRPKPLKYPKHHIRFRPYGVLIENVIKKITSEEDSEEKEQTIVNIANHLKKQYLNWNRDSVNDVLIFEHLDVLSGGKLKLKENFKFSSTREILNGLAVNNNNNGKSGGNKNKNKNKKNNNNPNTASGNANRNKNGANKITSNNNRKNNPQTNQPKAPTNNNNQ